MSKQSKNASNILSCNRKKRYDSISEAREMGLWKVYICPVCKFIHRATPRMRKRRKA